MPPPIPPPHSPGTSPGNARAPYARQPAAAAVNARPKIKPLERTRTQIHATTACLTVARDTVRPATVKEEGKEGAVRGGMLVLGVWRETAQKRGGRGGGGVGKMIFLTRPPLFRQPPHNEKWCRRGRG